MLQAASPMQDQLLTGAPGLWFMPKSDVPIFTSPRRVSGYVRQCSIFEARDDLELARMEAVRQAAHLSERAAAER